jgi:hypothetical protein
VSGFSGDFSLKYLLNIENKFSNPGYHKSKIIKKGDIRVLLI